MFRFANLQKIPYPSLNRSKKRIITYNSTPKYHSKNLSHFLLFHSLFFAHFRHFAFSSEKHRIMTLKLSFSILLSLHS